MKRTLAIIMGTQLLLAMPIFSQEQHLHQFTLDNGLTVILDENHDKPEVFGYIVVKAGGKNDPADATGMAHYQEHMLFKGTTQLGTKDWEKEKPHIDRIFALYDELGKTTDATKRAEIQKSINEESLKANEYAIPNELSNLINEMGGTNVNAGTGFDFTIYHNKFPSNQIERWLDLYAHRFTEPVFRGFQAELEVVYEEKNRQNDQIISIALEELMRSIFKNHPYGQQTVIGTTEDLKNPSLSKMYQFFKTYYVPNNMALILSGDFSTKDIIPVIEEKFGVWKPGELPEPRTWDEQPFNGREFRKVKMTPVKMGALVFRSPSQKDKNSLATEVMIKILNNSYSTGLLDKLTIDGKIMAAQSTPFSFMDHGAVLILMVPKIIGQSLEKAEALVLAEIEKLKKGEFENWVLDAIKQEMYRSNVHMMEQSEGRAYNLAMTFLKGEPIESVFSYTDSIKQITKQDVVALANQIFGKNYLAFHSKMGFPKKDKISKPGYEPLKPDSSAQRSQYAQHFDRIPVQDAKIAPISFENDIERATLSNGTELRWVENRNNDIFTLNIEFNVGTAAVPLLNYVSSNYIGGPDSLTVGTLKEEFAKVGVTSEITTTSNKMTIDISGVESGLQRAVELLGAMIKSPSMEQKRKKTIIEETATERKLEHSEVKGVANALLHYALFGNESRYTKRLSTKEVKQIQVSQIVDAFKLATGYKAQVYFYGKTPIGTVATLMDKHIPLTNNPLTDITPLDRPMKEYTENTILFVDKPKSRQSNIYFFINGEPFSTDDAVAMEAFNEYFGGGFNGLVLQEIREYRSLSYEAGGNFTPPITKDKPMYFIGFVGTQADKTLTAMETYTKLIRQMPQKTERTSMIQSFMELSAQTKRPDRRKLASTVESWKLLGYTADPIVQKLPQYKTLKWETINNFYESRMKNKPTAYIIVGDKKKIDMNELAKYGKVVEIKENTLFTK